MNFVDTHAHIHFADYGLDAEQVWVSSKLEGVDRMIAVGCRLDDSQGAINFAKKHDGVWASVGVHPHEAHDFLKNPENKKIFENLLKNPSDDKIVAIGETGLDYFYEHSNKLEQRKLLEYQLELARSHDLPLALHVREAFDDFWPIFDQFKDLRGVVHSFSSDRATVDQIISRGLYVGLNGIVTFTKQQSQLDAVKAVPLDRILLETDAPYLTPKPFRGKVCKPEYVKLVALFLSELRGEPIEQVAEVTTNNAKKVFGIQ